MHESLDRAIADALASLVDVYEQVVPDSGVFPPYVQRLSPSQHEYRMGTIEISIGGFKPDGTEEYEKQYHKWRYLQVCAHTPSGKSHSRAWVKSGTKVELLASLRNPDTVRVIHQAVAKMAQSLEENDYL